MRFSLVCPLFLRQLPRLLGYDGFRLHALFYLFIGLLFQLQLPLFVLLEQLLLAGVKFHLLHGLPGEPRGVVNRRRKGAFLAFIHIMLLLQIFLLLLEDLVLVRQSVCQFHHLLRAQHHTALRRRGRVQLLGEEKIWPDLGGRDPHILLRDRISDLL